MNMNEYTKEAIGWIAAAIMIIAMASCQAVSNKAAYENKGCVNETH